MKAEEIFKVKDYLDCMDIMLVFSCGLAKARSIIRAIKYVSDISGLTGKVTKKDHYLWSRIDSEDKAQ